MNTLAAASAPSAPHLDTAANPTATAAPTLSPRTPQEQARFEVALIELFEH